MAKRVSDLLSRIDLSTIMFFLGILMAVAVLQEIGVLTALGQGLNEAFAGNYFLINGIIGVLSSIVDNVPLVAGCMGMYPVAAEGAMAVDGIFWQLLAYCAGVGGSHLRHPLHAPDRQLAGTLVLSHHGSAGWCCCHGFGEDHLWLVYEEDYLDSFCGLSGRYAGLLGRAFAALYLISLGLQPILALNLAEK